ncbi:MAG: IS6 family transposase [Candidatus Bathyarchaeia archaeon]
MGFSKRELKGLELAIKGHVKACEGHSFTVKSERSDSLYEVRWEKKRWTCTCMDYMRHKRKCKHIFAVIYYLTIREVAVGMRDESTSITCPYCNLDDQVIKRGYAYEKAGKVQRYYCKRCNKRFNYRSGLEGTRGEALAILLALDLYYRGLSLRDISQHLESIYGVKVSHTTIHGWIKRYVELISKVTEKIKFETGFRWHSDETKLKVRGRHILLWSILDGETRLLIAQHISEKCTAEEACATLKNGLQKVLTPPVEVVTDGCQAYPEAIAKVLPGEVLHIQGPFSSPVNNNKIERYFRTLKQRFHSIHSFGDIQGAETFAKGFAVFYNMIRRHRALEDKTPSELTGVKLARRWQDLIKEIRKLKGTEST